MYLTTHPLRKLTFIMVAATLVAIFDTGSVTNAADADDDTVDTVVHAGTLIAVPGKKPATKQSVLIRDGMIVGVKNGYVSPQGAKVIDLTDAYVLPGLMDMHVHVLIELGPKTKMEEIEMRITLQAFRAQMYANRLLEAGFTTVRDVGGFVNGTFSLRDAINAGYVSGPRIFAAGIVGPTGGFGDEEVFRPVIQDLLRPEHRCDGPYACRAEVRMRIREGADLIKISATGSVLAEARTGTGLQMQDDEMRDVVVTAHALGRKVAAHAHDKVGIEAALRAGVDSIEHGSYGDKETMKLYRETGAYLVPTTLVGATVVDMAKNSEFMTPAVRAKALAVGPQMVAMLSIAYKEGVKIAFGTDSGVSKHGINAQEFLYMKEAGMSEEDMIISATINAADLLGESKTLGTIEVGKHADIIAVDGNPLEDISELLDVSFVMKGGWVAKARN
jgi:imidazolonepropionase-like amidohydrolase